MGDPLRRWPYTWRCQIDMCRAACWRYCRVCQRWVCRDHRSGSGWWWRCIRCPREALYEVMREHAAQERAERLGAPWGRPPRPEDPQLHLWFSPRR